MTQGIVVGFDGSPLSRLAVEWAADEASLRHAELHVVTCVHHPLTGPDIDLTGDAVRVAEGTTDGDLEDLRREVRGAHPDLEVSTATRRGEATRVLRTAGRGADLLVVGATGRTPLSPRDLGETARSLAMRADCDVVVVPRHVAPGRVERIVAAVDGSSRDDAVVAAAAQEARLHRAPLAIVHCSTTPRSGEAAAVVDHAARLLGAMPVGSVTTHVVDARTIDGVLGVAEGHVVVVVGRHHSNAFTAALAGSSAVALVRHSPVPTMVVGARGRGRGRAEA